MCLFADGVSFTLVETGTRPAGVTVATAGDGTGNLKPFRFTHSITLSRAEIYVLTVRGPVKLCPLLYSVVCEPLFNHVCLACWVRSRWPKPRSPQ